MKKSNFLRRGLCLLLAFVLVAGYLTPAGAVEPDAGLTFGIEQIGNDAVSAELPLAKVDNTAEAEKDMNEMVRVSIQLEQASTLDAGFHVMGSLTDTDAVRYRDSLKRGQEALTASIERQVLKGRKLDVVWNLTLAANVISANVPRSAISAIEKLDGVARVVEENCYEPQVASVGGTYEPQMAISGQMTGAQQSWQAGYTGAGMRIAVIDTGLDTDHQSFAEDAFLHAVETAASATGKSYDLMDVEDIAAVLTELNAYTRQQEAGVTLTAEDLYINAKAAYGYNYIDANLDVTHDNDSQGEHGSHVAGIAAANRFIKKQDVFVDAARETGVAGNAPDAQLLTMKVFGANGGAYDSDILAAMEDALILGADAINLSLGSPLAGRTYSDDPLYEELFNSLTETDTVVSISGGNYGYWAENTYYGYLFNDDVNFATGGTPGTYANSLAVASVDNDGDFSGDLIVGEHTFGYLESLGDGYVEYGNVALGTLDTSMKATGTDYDFVYLDGFGYAEDYAGIDLTGKIVFVSRGEISFLEKAHNAAALGALAVVVCNNQPGVVYMDLTGLEYAIPVVAIAQTNAAYVREGGEMKTAKSGLTYYTGTVTVVGTVTGHYNDSEFKTISSFSSWGVPSDLKLKPEIAAPGGNIYSVNGVDPSGTGYELMSGTSMAAPQVAGMSALMLQYLQENGIQDAGMTDRALAQSLLMATAEPLINGNNGSYYAVMQQGSGLGNVSDAMASPVYITVEGQDDGKVKAELGDDAERTGVYSFTFDLNNLSDEAVSYRLSGDVFTQDVFESEEGIRYLDTLTRPMDAQVEFRVNGEVLETDDLTAYDFNNDGITDKADAQLLLNAVTTGEEPNGDLSGDGLVNTYDVHLLLKQCALAVEVGGGEAVTVEVTIRLSDGEKERLNDENPAGAYVQAFVFAEAMANDEGVVLPTLSIPVLAYYGGWHEPSMFDETCYTTYFTGEEEREPYWATSYVNGVGVTYGDNANVTYYFGGNPIEADSKYMPERNAINLERGDYFRGFDFGLIRNAGAHRAVITNTTTGEELFYEEGGAVDAAYYYAALGGWLNVPQTFELDFAPDMEEGERGNLKFDALVELYNGDWSKADSMEMPFIVDNTAPVIVEDSVVVDREKNVLRLTVSDNQHVAGVVIYDVTGRKQLALCGADQDAPAGSTVELEVPLDAVNGYKFVIQVVDYAVNKTTYKLKETIGTPEPMPEMLYYSSTFREWNVGDWPASSTELVSYEGWFASEIDVVAATAVGSYVYFVDGDKNLYAAPGDNLFEFAKVTSLDYLLADMTYDRENGIIYALYSVDSYESMLISIDRMTGVVTELGTLAAGYYPGATLAYVGDGKFFMTSDSNYPNLYTFTLDGGKIGPVTQVGYINPYSSGYDCLEYNPNDGYLYLVCNNSSSADTQAYELNRIDPKNPTNGSYVNSDYRYFYGEVTTLIFPDWSDAANDWYDPSGEVVAVTLNKEHVEVFRDKTYQLTVGVAPWHAENREVLFTSSDPSVATVSSKGLITGVGEGSAVITVTSAANPAVYAQCTVTVSVLDVQVEGVLVWDNGSADVTNFFTWDVTSGEPWEAGAQLQQDAIAAAPIPGSENFFILNPGYAAYEMDGAGKVVAGPYSYMPDNYYYPHGLAYSALYSAEDSDWVYYIRNGSLVRPRAIDGKDYVYTYSMGYDHDNLMAVASAGTELYSYNGGEYLSDVLYLVDNTGAIWRANIFTYNNYDTFRYSRTDSTLPKDLFASKEYSSLVVGDDGALYLSAFTGKSNKLYRLAYNADDDVYDAMELGNFGENVWPAIVMDVQSNQSPVTAVPVADQEGTVQRSEVPAGSTQAITVTDGDQVVDGGGIKVDCAEKTVTVPVYAMDSTNGLVELRYDSQLLTLVSAEGGAVMTCVDDSTNGLVRIGYADASEIDAVVATLVFSVNTEKTQETALTLTTLEDCNSTVKTEELVEIQIPGHVWKGTGCENCDATRENPFTDVPEDSFYIDPVLWAVENGITTGATETTFDPNGSCQRAAVVTFLWRAAGSPEPSTTENPFTDVKETDFYYKAVLWAVEKKITNGLTADTFGPFALCNRAQVVTFLYRAMGAPAVTSTENPFSDVDAAAWYGPAVLWAVEKGITNGMSATEFGVNSICNRAQVVTFLYRTMA